MAILQTFMKENFKVKNFMNDIIVKNSVFFQPGTRK